MDFADFIKTLDKYYRPYVEPYYTKGTTNKSGQADFVRSLFIAATVGQDDLFEDISLPRKIYSSGKVSEDIAGKILSDLDKLRFIDFLSQLASVDSTVRLCKAFAITSEVKSVLYDYIYDAFVAYLENASGNTNEALKKEKVRSAIKKAPEPITFNLNNMRFFASENNGIKLLDNDTEKTRCSITYLRDFDNTAEPKAFAMVAYIYQEPTSWLEYAQNDFSFIFKGQISQNISYVQLEIKYLNKNVRDIAIDKKIKNKDGLLEGQIALADYDVERLGTIIEICFTVFNENCTSIGEHLIEISQLSIEPI